MNCNYSSEEVREIVETHRAGESLDEYQERMAGDWIESCLRKGLDPVQEIRKAFKGYSGTDRDRAS